MYYIRINLYLCILSFFRRTFDEEQAMEINPPLIPFCIEVLRHRNYSNIYIYKIYIKHPLFLLICIFVAGRSAPLVLFQTMASPHSCGGLTPVEASPNGAGTFQ